MTLNKLKLKWFLVCMGPTTENCVFSYSIKLNKLKVDVVAPALGVKRRAPSDGAWRLLQVLPLALAQAPCTERRRWRQTHPKPLKNKSETIKLTS
jgi:hypothetical protein